MGTGHLGGGASRLCGSETSSLLRRLAAPPPLTAAVPREPVPGRRRSPLSGRRDVCDNSGVLGALWAPVSSNLSRHSGGTLSGLTKPARCHAARVGGDS